MDKIKKIINNFTRAFGFSLPTDMNIKHNETSLEIEKELQIKLGRAGNILYYNKSEGYDLMKKTGKIYVANSNIFTSGGYKVWFGDFSGTTQVCLSLQDISTGFKTIFYVLKEYDGKFLKTPPKNEYLEEKYIVKIDGTKIDVRLI